MRAMYYKGTGSAQVLGYGTVTVGMQFVGGPSWPCQSSGSTGFAPGVVYTVTGIYHQADLPMIGGTPGDCPTPWDTDAGTPNTTDSPDYVRFDTSIVGLNGTNPIGGSSNIGNWFPATILANAVFVGGGTP